MSDSQFAMISDWMVNGNVNDFVKGHPDTDRLDLVGFQLKILTAFASGRLTTDNFSSW